MTLSTISSVNRENLLKFWDWMETTGRAKIVSFQVPGRKLYELINLDVATFNETNIERVLSDKIDQFIRIPSEKKKYFIEKSDTHEWTWDNDPDLYICYQMLKFLWLAEDMGWNNQEAPVQLIQTGRNYNCHPGSDKKNIITYLQPMPWIRGFYIWYPEFDQTPWHWSINHDYISNPDDFIKMFHRATHDTFNFKYTEAKFTYSGYETEPHFEPWACGLHLGMKKWGHIQSEKFNITLPTLSYHDGVHRQGIHDRRDLFDKLRVHKDKFDFGKFTFVKYRGMWVYAKWLNQPKSLIDTEYKYNREIAISSRNRKVSAIGRYRPGL